MFSWLKKSKIQESSEIKKVPKILHFNDDEAKILLEEIKKEFGLDYEKQKQTTLRKIERFAIKNEIATFHELEISIRTSQELKKKLLNMLTVGETYFYRELGHLKILVEYLQKNSVKNILCAPSSSGEEVFSILIYLKESQTQGVKVTGIDLNSDVIETAEKGCYSERSLSPLPAELHTKYFTKNENRYCIDKIFQESANFYHQNIFDDSFLKLGSFEVVFCRNMLIYFNDTQKRKALTNIHTIMPHGGILFLGHADLSFTPDGFTKQVTPHGNYLVKI